MRIPQLLYVIAKDVLNVERVAGTRARLEVASLCRQRAASAARAASGATATTAGGMRQVTNSRKAAARYRAEYLRQSNAPTSAAATCDNTVRCARAALPRAPSPASCIPHDIELETSRTDSAHSICSTCCTHPDLLYLISLYYLYFAHDTRWLWTWLEVGTSYDSHSDPYRNVINCRQSISKWL